MVKWLDEDEMRAWRGLVDVFADVEASLGAELAENHGISSGDYAVLVALSEAEGHRLRMCDLALCCTFLRAGSPVVSTGW